MFLLMKSYFYCFRQPPSKFTLILAPLKKVTVAARLLFDVIRDLMLPSDNPSDFHAMI